VVLAAFVDALEEEYVRGASAAVGTFQNKARKKYGLKRRERQWLEDDMVAWRIR
jgi:hypothetical protein